ncbi:MAG: D-glycero-beta-D-manno-heptose 1-phosphate adenylyltransferase [Armatimonadota bacterium]
MGEVITREGLSEVVARLRAQGRRIALTNGCFDLLHVGHVRYLTQARRLADVLVVGLNSDDSVRRLKGPARPLTEAGDRAETLAALAAVDYVVIFEEDTAIPLLEEVAPDVYVKGGDFREEQVPEAPVARRLGCEVQMIGLAPGRSTSDLIERIKRL